MKPKSEAYHLDCMKYMAGAPDKTFAIGLADPPYALGQNLAKARSRSKLAATAVKHDFDWDNAIPGREYFKELIRVTRNQIIWGANYFPEVCGVPFKAPRRQEYQKFIEEHPTNWIIWDKVNGDSDFSDCELAYTSFPICTQIFYFMWAGMRQGLSMQHGTVMQGNKALNEKRVHPTQKPLPLYQWQLQTFAKPGDTILSTHMGSQNDRIAAYKMGFAYFGTEISEQHYNDGCRRFQEQINTPLFQL